MQFHLTRKTVFRYRAFIDSLLTKWEFRVFVVRKVNENTDCFVHIISTDII